MKITIDMDEAKIEIAEGDSCRIWELYSRQALEELSRIWVKVGWNQKYQYTFSWLGRPVIQLPEDLVRVQEVLYRVQPDVILETGVAHGGSLIFYASICRMIGKGRVVGVDIEIRAHNRRAIETHELASSITLIEGDSASPETVKRVKQNIKTGEKVLVLLDSCHTRAHVSAELEAYHSLITSGSYMVVTDGIMRDLTDVPRGKAEWCEDNPISAAKDFLAKHRDFILEQPHWPFNESELDFNVTHWPDAFLKKI